MQFIVGAAKLEAYRQGRWNLPKGESSVGRRREQRIVLRLPIRVSGTDFNGNPFAQDAETINISRRGARLHWLTCLRGPGELIEVRYKNEKARFKVVWIGELGTSEQGQVGIEAVDKKYIWGTALPSSQRDDYTLPEVPPTPEPQPWQPLKIESQPAWTGEERRYAPRYRCAGDVELINPGTGITLHGSLSDISVGGCYVEMMAPLTSGKEVELRLTAKGVTLKARGVVRASHPAIGMGIEFTEMRDEDRQRLDQLIAQLAGKVPAEAAAAATSAPLSTHAFDNKLMLETLVQLLQSKGVLTREEFLQALERAASSTSPK